VGQLRRAAGGEDRGRIPGQVSVRGVAAWAACGVGQRGQQVEVTRGTKNRAKIFA